MDINGKGTPYPAVIDYHAPDEQDKFLSDTIHEYRKLVSNIRYIADSKRPEIAFVVGRLGAESAKPTERHWRIMKSTFPYLKRTRNFGLFFRKHDLLPGVDAVCITRPL